MIKLSFKLLILFLFVAKFSFSQTKEDVRFYELFSDSQKLLLLEEPDSAGVLLEKCLELKPNSSSVNYSLARIYSSEGQSILAISYAEKAYELDENNIWYLRFLANLYSDSYSYNEAGNIYSTLLSFSPFISDFDNAVNFYDSINDYESELLVLDLILKKFGSTFDNLKRKIDICFKMNNQNCVIQNCENIIEKFPNNPNSYILYIDYLLSYKKYDSCYNYIKIGKKKFPDNYTFFYYSAIYFSENQNVDSSFYYIHNVINSRQYSGLELINLLNKYEEFYSYENFGTRLDTIVTTLDSNYFDNFDVLKFSAEFYFNKNKFFDAINFFELALKQDVTDFELYISLFNLYNRFNFWEQLDSLATVASELYPAQPLVYLFSGIASLELQNYDEAYEYFVLGNSLVFEQPKLTAFFNFYLSQYFRIDKDISNENLFYNNAISSASNNCDLLAYFAFYYAKNKISKDKAFSLIGQCIIADLDSLSPYISFIYSYVLYKFGDYESALNYANIAISNSKYENFTHYELLGNIQSKLGLTEQAKSSWLKSVNLGNKFLNKEL